MSESTCRRVANDDVKFWMRFPLSFILAGEGKMEDALRDEMGCVKRGISTWTH